MKLNIEIKDSGEPMQDLRCSIQIYDLEFDKIENLKHLTQAVENCYDSYLKSVLTEKGYSVFKKNSSK